jgi:hypoxanthine-DNA glycosylase
VTGSYGFAPLAAPGATVLVLGSLPGRQSLLLNEYYGNPRNVFWRIMGALFDAGQELPYAQRVPRLLGHKIAVWDVLRYSVRPGSMDADIDDNTAQANDFAGFFSEYCEIRRVYFNGKKAAQVFARLVLESLPDENSRLEFSTLPSTSPAHAAMSFTRKLERWSIIKGDCNVP